MSRSCMNSFTRAANFCLHMMCSYVQEKVQDYGKYYEKEENIAGK